MTRHTLADVPTPALVVDLAAVDRNIQRQAAYGKKHNLGVRPHTKTHKSLFMAKRQLAAGAIGLTVAKVGEAREMVHASQDILIAYPALDPARTAGIAQLARGGATVRVAVDSAFAVDAIAAAVAQAPKPGGTTVGILVDIDVGFHRTGLQTPELALALAQKVDRTKGLRLDGIFCYPGHVVVPSEKHAEVLAPVQKILAETIALWKKHGLAAPIVSAGSTPTGLTSHLIPALTEVRPGTYIYMDRNYMTGGWATIDDCAARLLCTVVSDAVPNKVVLDAGSKTFTSDRLLGDPGAAKGFGLIVEYPQATIVRCSEEHGEVDLAACEKRPKLGERVQVIPNHICPCVNLQDTIWLKQPDGSLEPLPIEARGHLS
ncbi:MAG: alanine racemase [Planctomycetota bacterium]|nr:alanine racemase [Planctomycetota bacterium]